jgi:hypothetical protein
MITAQDRFNKPLPMNSEPPENDKNLSDDLKIFENLPSKIQELLLLGEESEKATGKAQERVDHKINSHPN